MSQSPIDNRTLSLMLSEVMEDIGVNEEMVKRRQHIFMLMEDIENVIDSSAGKSITVYNLGSQSEGTTSIGLNSDFDMLNVYHKVNVMQDLSELKEEKYNYQMIQDENVTPGYCFLRLVKSAHPEHVPGEHHFTDDTGRILLKNTIMDGIREGAERNGPANVIIGEEGYADVDVVYAFKCDSWPNSALNFHGRQGITRLFTSEMIRYAASNGCFVVGASSKISTFPQLEWRISTSLVERCLMYNLNITQIQCYVLMKMVLKTFLNPQKENGLSSFMCKNVLLHCIANTAQLWVKDNLLKCLTDCLKELQSCVQNDHCSHFLIPANNLMAGQFRDEMKREILEAINAIIQRDDLNLVRISIDDIGQRLQAKLILASMFATPNRIEEDCVSRLLINLVQCIVQASVNMNISFQKSEIKDLEKFICNLTNFSVSDGRNEHLARRYVLPLFRSTLGSTLAAQCIGRNDTMSSKAMTCLYSGLDPDVTSGRLKLASVFYCTGDIYNAYLILRQMEREYDSGNVVPICRCLLNLVPRMTVNFKRKCRQQNEDYVIRHMTSFCVLFLPDELNVVPRELRYEMKRSLREDMLYKTPREKDWMDCAVIDSLPLLYFLQFKTYDHLQKDQEKQHALNNLRMSINTDQGIGHKETALNLLGQCMEQENNPETALMYYMLSRQHRPRNNVANVLICCLIAEFVRNRSSPNYFIVLYERDKKDFQ